MRQEVVIQPSPRGAARTLDASFPSFVLQTLTNTTLGGNFISRQTQIQFNLGANTSAGGGSTSQWVYHNGRVCYRWSGTGLSSNYWTSGVAGGSFAISFPTLKSGVGGTFQDDYRCWRIMMTLAVDAGFSTTGDNGLDVGPQNDFNVVVAAVDGIAFRPTSNTSFGVRIKQGHVITFDADVATDVDVTLFNTIELRIIGATATTDAVVKAYVNNVQRQAWAFGAGTVLPNLVDGGGGGIGWNIGVGNRGSPAIYLPMGGLRIIAAATEDGLL